MMGPQAAGAAVGSDDAGRLAVEGGASAEEGRLEAAASDLERTLAEMGRDRRPAPYLKSLMRLAGVYQALGFHQTALKRLNGAAPAVEKSGDPALKAAYHGALGDLYLSLKRPDEAMSHMEKAAEAARQTDDPAVAAAGLLGLGNFYTAVGYADEAVAAYETCVGVVESAGGPVDDALSSVRAKALINLMRLLLKAERFREAAVAMDYAVLQTARLPDTPETAMDLMALHRVIRDFRQNPAVRDSLAGETDAEETLLRVAYDILADALAIGRETGDHRIRSYANGYLGQLYEEASRYRDAIRLTETAAFLAEVADLPEILYRWQWQLGRLYAAFGDRGTAIRFYHAAVETLNPIRHLFFNGYRDAGGVFQQQIKPVYLELVDLLLDGVRTLPAGGARRARLREIRDVMESLKTAELEDFLADECLAAEGGNGFEHTPEGSALLYPIILADKLALILTLPDTIRYVAVPVRSEKLEETVRRFRERLQTRSNHLYQHEAQQLYDWLIRPIASALADGGIDTLIVAPDGVLRSIPFAALHDGDGFLVERFAVGVVPAVALTDLTPFQQDGREILLGGISESVQDFPELPSVPQELAAIRRIMGVKDILKDENFTLERITQRFRTARYDVLHLATHGVFGGSSEETFLLTHDGRLTLNRLKELIGLGRYRKKKVELITLSACQTALGDERATLGLAGVAVQAGAKSAIATLWFIDDEAASIAIREYYTQLKAGGVSKAAALQNTQKKLIARKRYRHPAYWAPFLLIGNWM